MSVYIYIPDWDFSKKKRVVGSIIFDNQISLSLDFVVPVFSSDDEYIYAHYDYKGSTYDIKLEKDSDKLSIRIYPTDDFSSSNNSEFMYRTFDTSMPIEAEEPSEAA